MRKQKQCGFGCSKYRTLSFGKKLEMWRESHKQSINCLKFVIEIDLGCRNYMRV